MRGNARRRHQLVACRDFAGGAEIVLIGQPERILVGRFERLSVAEAGAAVAAG